MSEDNNGSMATQENDPTQFKAIAEKHKEMMIASLRRYVQELGLAEVERRTGISQAQISQYTSGRKSAPTLITLVRISRGLETTVSELIGDDTGHAKDLFPDQKDNIPLINKLLHAKREELELMHELISLPAKPRAAVFQIIKSLNEK